MSRLFILGPRECGKTRLKNWLQERGFRGEISTTSIFSVRKSNSGADVTIDTDDGHVQLENGDMFLTIGEFSDHAPVSLREALAHAHDGLRETVLELIQRKDV